jgi:phage gpG-like protein
VAVRTNEITSSLNTLKRNITKGVETAMSDVGRDIVRDIQSNMRSGVDIDRVPFAPNTEATKQRKTTQTVLIERQQLINSWAAESRGSQTEVFTDVIYATTMQFGARKGQFGTNANGNPIPWGDIPPRKMIPNEGEPLPPAWDKILDNRIKPLVNW